MSTATLASEPDSVNPNGESPDNRPSAAAPNHAPVVIPPASASADLIGRIAEAMADAGEVTKNSRNTDQNYNFASAETILAAVRLPLLQRRILLTQTPKGYETETITSNRGTAGTLLTITIDFTFRCGLTGEILTIDGWRGQGQDYGDKAYGKAYTNAVKTFIRAQWLLPAGDDPEASPSGDRMAKGGGGGGQVTVVPPAWAAPANDATKLALIGALEQVIGDRAQAKTFAAALAAKCGGFPDTIAKWVISLPDWIGTKPQPTEADAARAAQDAAAEKPPPPPETEDPADLPAGYQPGPAPGSVPLPPLSGLDENQAAAALRTAGCTCLDPVGPDDQTDTGCPLAGHGIPW